MASRALVFLLALFLLILPILSNNRSAPPSATLPPGTADATLEATAAPTQEPTLAATIETTPETTASPTGEVSRFPSQLLIGDPAHGQFIFDNGLNGAPACINCHGVNAVGKVGFALGPGLRGIADTGAERIADFSAPLYIEDSIRYPNDFITSGFRGIMYANFAHDYSNQEIADLIAYLMTLHLVPDSIVPAA